MKLIGNSPKVLIFCSAGDRIKSLSWIDGLQHHPMLTAALVYYGSEALECPQGVDYFMKNRDFKIPNFLQLIREHPSILNFDIFLFVDDDIIVSANQLRLWCNIVQEQSLDVSQPALTPESKADWPHVKWQPGLTLDQGQFIEVQCFALSRRALQLALPFFFMVKTGAGLDLALYRLAKVQGLKTAVLQDIQVVHPYRPEDQTVRKQFGEFNDFNRQMSLFMDFCFEGRVDLDSLVSASVVCGDTRYGVVRCFYIIKFIISRINRVIRRAINRG
jgi:hypothetical protein